MPTGVEQDESKRGPSRYESVMGGGDSHCVCTKKPENEGDLSHLNVERNDMLELCLKPNIVSSNTNTTGAIPKRRSNKQKLDIRSMLEESRGDAGGSIGSISGIGAVQFCSRSMKSAPAGMYKQPTSSELRKQMMQQCKLHDQIDNSLKLLGLESGDSKRPIIQPPNKKFGSTGRTRPRCITCRYHEPTCVFAYEPAMPEVDSVSEYIVEHTQTRRRNQHKSKQYRRLTDFYNPEKTEGMSEDRRYKEVKPEANNLKEHDGKGYDPKKYAPRRYKVREQERNMHKPKEYDPNMKMTDLKEEALKEREQKMLELKMHELQMHEVNDLDIKEQCPNKEHTCKEHNSKPDNRYERNGRYPRCDFEHHNELHADRNRDENNECVILDKRCEQNNRNERGGDSFHKRGCHDECSERGHRDDCSDSNCPDERSEISITEMHIQCGDREECCGYNCINENYECSLHYGRGVCNGREVALHCRGASYLCTERCNHDDCDGRSERNDSQVAVRSDISDESLSLSIHDVINSTVVNDMIRKMQRVYMNSLKEEVTIIEALQQVPAQINEVYRTNFLRLKKE